MSPGRRKRAGSRCAPLVGALLALAACGHGAPAGTATRPEQREDWLLALKSDVERNGETDGFQGQLRVMHGGAPEIARTFGDPGCLPLGAGRRLLAAVAVGVLVDAGKLSFDDGLERRLPSVQGTSFAPLTVTHLLTDSAGLALEPVAARDPDRVEQRLEAAGTLPLHAPPGTRVDPGDDRPWLLVERLVAHVAGQPFEQFVRERVLEPARMTSTSLVSAPGCPEGSRGTTTLDDQFRLIDALRSATVVSRGVRDTLWAPRLPLGPGADVGEGFFLRSDGERRAVGIFSEGRGPSFELWLDPAGSDALVLIGRTPPKTGHGIRTALGEFYALPPQAATPSRSRRSVASPGR